MIPSLPSSRRGYACFGLDLPRSPVVLIRESTNEGLHLSWNWRLPGVSFRNGSPIQPESLAMPAGDGVGLDDDEGLSPSRPELRQEDPEAAVCCCDSGLGSFLGVGGELLAQREFDQGLLAPAPEKGWNTAE